MVWVWMGEAPADEASIPEYRFLDADSGFHISRRDHVTIQANVRLVMNNLLDLSHAPLLHEGILGHEDSIRAEINTEQQDPYFFAVRRMRGVRPGALTDLQFRRDGQPIDVVLKMRWSAPCNPLNDSLSSEAGGSATEGGGALRRAYSHPGGRQGDALSFRRRTPRPSDRGRRRIARDDQAEDVGTATHCVRATGRADDRGAAAVPRPVSRGTTCPIRGRRRARSVQSPPRRVDCR